MHYWNIFSSQWAMPFNFVGGWIGFIFLIVWSLIWKGMALWKAARQGDKNWFIALLVINTAGILDILYIYFFGKKAELVEKDPVT
jgi:hypothetical protein